jgi:hypothetical protein
MSARSLTTLALPVIALTLALAACGGGGSSPSTPPGITGTLSSTVAGVSFANSPVLYSCGCDGQAGEVTADANGNFALPVSASAVPASPSPTYTLAPGRTYAIVGDQPTGTQAWTLEFLGNTPATNLNLYGTKGATTTDQYTAATALFVYYQSANFSGDQAYSRWNFNSLINWTQALKASGTGSNAAEQQYLSDINAAQAANQSLFPAIPAWDPKAGDTANATIVNDIQAVANSADANLPTPCPSTGCTGTPSP